MPEQRAYSYGAEGKKEVAPQAFMQDKCFLCGNEIGETDPRQFYTGPKGSVGIMMLAHTPCLNAFIANGEVWPPGAPVEESTPVVEAQVKDLGSGYRRVVYNNARLAYNDKELVLLCTLEIAQHGLKAVIPDLIVALQAAGESL